MKIKLSRKEQEQQFHKNLIIKAAAQIFSEKGYDKTTLDEIATLAEFSKGSLYNYFENKEDLFLTTLEVGINKLISEMKIVSDIDSSTKQQIKACVGCIEALRLVSIKHDPDDEMLCLACHIIYDDYGVHTTICENDTTAGFVDLITLNIYIH